MSSGKTRDTGLPFLKSVDCSDNLYDKEYLLQYHYRKRIFMPESKKSVDGNSATVYRIWSWNAMIADM